MICIGNIDKSKSMLDQLDTYEVNGYKVSDLNERDYALIRGVAWMIDEVDMYCEHECGEYGSVIDKLKEEIVEEAKADMVARMLGEMGIMLFTLIDRYKEEGTGE